MPWGLQRFQQSEQSHFVTFCCYHRRPSLSSPQVNQAFEAALERVRRSFELQVFGYVLMPEHVHLLLGEPQRQTLAHANKSLKQGVARRFIGNAEHFWQKRFESPGFSSANADFWGANVLLALQSAPEAIQFSEIGAE